jgi:hypothetical protein
MSYDRDRSIGDYFNGAGARVAPALAPGRSTLTSRIQRRAAADAPAPASSPTTAPTAATSPEAAEPEPFIDPFGIHLLDQTGPTADRRSRAPVQRTAAAGHVEVRQAVTIDAPKEVEETRATLDVAPHGEPEAAPRLNARQLATARHRNAHHAHHLRFDVAAFGGSSPDTNEFALAVASYQAAAGGTLKIDGIAGPQTCKHKGCLHSDHAADHAAGHGDDDATGEASPSLESTRGRRDAVGAAARALPSAIDAPKEVDNTRATLPIQARAPGPRIIGPEQVHARAAAGVQGPGSVMPHAEPIKKSFGAHASIVDGIQAHVGGPAAEAATAIGAVAYATGNAVAFQSSPDLFTAAHEAAHVVQQRAGVQLLGGVGDVGDIYEQHADTVAAAVVRGERAEHLLTHHAGSSSASTTNAPVQRAPAAPTAADTTSRTAAAAAGANMFNPGDRDPLDHVASLLVVLPAEAANALRGAVDGTLPVSEGCALLARLLGPVTAAIGVAVRWMRSTEWVADNPERHARDKNLAQVFAYLDETWGPVAGLIALSATRGAEFNLGAPVLREVFHATTTAATALGYIHNPAHVAAAKIVDVCPAGAHEDHVAGCSLSRAEREQLIDAITSKMSEAIGHFTTELETEEGVLRAGVAKSALLQSIINDTLISALVGLSGGLAAPAAASTMVKAARGAGGASEATALATYVATVRASASGATAAASGASLSHAQFVQLVKTGTKFELTQQSSDDARTRTLALIPALKMAAYTAQYQATIHLPALADDDLRQIDRMLDKTDFANTAHTFIERYRAQVEPIGDSFKAGEDTVQQRAVLLEGNGVRRLALVSVRIDGSLMGYAARGLIAGIGHIDNALHPSAEAPTNDQLWEYFVTTERQVDFVRWIDADLIPAAAALSDGSTLSLDRVDNGHDDAARGLTTP